MLWIGLEIGTWLGWLMSKFASRLKAKHYLIDGLTASETRQSFALVDNLLEHKTLSANNHQRKVAAGISRGLRFLVNTRACELAILASVQEKWPGAQKRVQKVRLHL